MGYQNALKRAREFINKQGGQIAPLPLSEEEIDPEIQDDLSYQAYALEATSNCYSIDYLYPQDSNCSEFTFFEDGRQRTVQIGFIPAKVGTHNVLVPIHFFVIAAVILQRKERELCLWEAPIVRQGIFVGRSLIPNKSVVEEFEKSGLEVIDTKDRGGDYYDLRRRALNRAKGLRIDAEEELISKWMASPDSVDKFLVIDGTLMNLRTERNIERCIGVSKSFNNRYFSVSEHNRILQMQEFERSWTFRFHSPEDASDDISQGARERVSWYLRLRKHHNSDPEFGLIRVEISKKHTENATGFANRFSRSLLSERLPTAYPLPRWDKHLYAIQACENYLSSIMPSLDTINASMKG